MKISREIIINGESMRMDYELTGIELEHAYNEYVEIHDKNEVIHHLRDLEYEDLDNIPEDIIADLASQVRERMEEYRDQAILDIIRKNEELLAPYKEAWKVFEIEVTQTRTKTWTIKAKNADDAERIFEKWRNKNTYEYDDDMANADDVDDDIGSAYESDGDPDEAEITEE